MASWSPFTFKCGLEVANRFVLAPLTTDASNDDGTAPDDEVEFVRRRAVKGFRAHRLCAASHSSRLSLNA
jgi:2,4-dienoyl-CoA reductase-like NADH-dependent reductase (Old Yellow Enzyme family)